MTKQYQLIKIILVTFISIWTLDLRSVRPPEFVPRQVFRYQIQLPAGAPISEYKRLQTWLLTQHFDVAGVGLKAGMVEVITDSYGVKLINAQGFYGKKIETRTGPDKRYLNPATLADKLKELHLKYPGQTKLVELGKTHQGRSLVGLLLSSTPDLDAPELFAKPSLLIDGLHHAREVMTPEISVDFAESLLAGRYARGILEKWNVWLIPMLNLDGSNIVWTLDNMWRKNAYPIDQKIVGVDVNRNYDYLWNACNGSSGSTWGQDYRGPKAASEPETRAIASLAALIRPSVYISYHAYGELIIYPYGCANVPPPELKLHQKFGQFLSSQLPSDSGKEFYRQGRSYELLYATDGTSIDYMSGVYGSLSFVFEVNSEFQPDYALRAPTVAKHRAALTKLLEASSKQLLSLRVLDSQGRAIENAKIEISSIPRKSEPPFLTNKAGYFFKVVEQAGFVLRVTLQDGRQKELKVDQLGQDAISIQFN